MTTRIAAILAIRIRMIARLIGQVTTIATTEHLRVVHTRNWIPRTRIVAGLAHIGGRNMIYGLSRCGRAIVATGATTRYTGVIETSG